MSVIRTREQVPQVRSGPGRPPGPPGTGAPPRAGGQGAGLSGKDLLRMLRKRLVMIVIIFTLCVAAAVGVTLLWLWTAPWYTATAYLEVVPPTGEGPLGQGQEPSDRIIRRYAASHVRMIQSEPILIKALQQAAIRNTRWRQELGNEDPVQELQDDIQARHEAGTALISVRMTGPYRDELPEIVNTVINVFVEEARTNLLSQYEEDRQNIQDELNTLQANLQDIRRQMAAMRPDEAGALEGRKDILEVRLRELSGQIDDLITAQRQTSAALRNVEQSLNQYQADATGEVVLPEQVRATVDADPVLSQNRRNLQALEGELESAKKKYGPQHRRRLDLFARIETLQEQIAARQEELTAETLRSTVTRWRNNLESIQEQLTAVTQQRSEVEQRLTELEGNLTEWERLRMEEQQLVRRATQLETRLQELKMISRAEGERGAVSVRQQATKPREVSMPRWSVTMPIGAVIGLLLAFGLAFLLEFIDTSVKGPSDVSRRIDLPLLGMVPHCDDIDEPIGDARLAFLEHPNSLICEAFRQVRTTLLFSGPVNQRRSLLVTSPLPADGRSTVALNLGASIARGGRSALIVDANFRQPAIQKLFPDVPDEGLSNALVGQSPWREAVREVEPNMYVLGSGPLPPNPAELLGSDQMRQIIGEMTSEYDQVIFEGAPCLVVSDPAILGTMVDGVVLVVRAGVNTYGIVQRSRDMLVRVGAHIMGVVLNGVRVTAGGYLRKNYDTFYEYHTQPQLGHEEQEDLVAAGTDSGEGEPEQ